MMSKFSTKTKIQERKGEKLILVFCIEFFDFWSKPHPSSETQGQSVEPGEKARRKFSRTGGRAPGYRLSPDHFQTVKWMLAPDWAQKMLCIIVPNRGTASPEFFSWVRTRRDSYWLDHGLSGAPNKCTQSGNFQFDVNTLFQNTGCLYTRLLSKT